MFRLAIISEWAGTFMGGGGCEQGQGDGERGVCGGQARTKKEANMQPCQVVQRGPRKKKKEELEVETVEVEDKNKPFNRF